MNEGWIKLHRCVLENDFLMNDDTAFTVFTKLLLTVGKNKGQWSGGRRQLGELICINPRTLYDVLIRLENQHLINITSNKRYSIITICNWHRYQHSAQPPIQPQPNHSPTTAQPQPNTLTRKRIEKEDIDNDVNNITENIETINRETGANFKIPKQPKQFTKFNKPTYKPIHQGGYKNVAKRI